MRDFIVFFAKLFFIALILLGALFLLLVIDFSYILAFIGVFVGLFIVCFAIVFVQTKNHYNKLQRIEQEKARVKYIIIN